MTQRKFRTLEELYGVSEEVSEPKITPVLKGGFRIQGPADEADPVIQGSCGTENEYSGGHFTSRKFRRRAESGMCNVCATPCSSCMHFDRMASLMGTETEFAVESCEVKVANRCSFNDAELLSPFKSSASEDRQRTNSETSNLLSVCSSHDSFSENAESKVILRTSPTPGDIEMGQPVAEDSGFSNPSTFHSKTIFLNQQKKEKDLECPGDDISCISRADCPIGDPNNKGGSGNVSYSSASVNSCPIVLGTVNFNSSSHCLVTKHCGEKLEHKSEFTKESLKTTADLSNRLDPLDISSLRGVFASPTSPKGEPSECSEEQVESLARVATSEISCQIGNIPNCARSVQSNTDLDDGHEEAQAVNFSKEKECAEKSSELLETLNVRKHPFQSQSVANNVRSDVLEYEVKVCDICGDAGREELLASCSNCSDGAEHIYCMRLKLEKVPEGDWMCEECMLQEETKKERKDPIGVLKGSSSDQTTENSEKLSTSNFKNFLRLDDMDTTALGNRTKNLDPTRQFSAKRPAESLETVPVTKRRTLETITGSSKMPNPPKRDIPSRDSSFENLFKEKVKQAHEACSFGDRPPKNSLQNACLPAVSGHKSPKSPRQLQMSRGSLLKSNSFNILDSKLKHKLPEKYVLQKQKLTRETDTSDMKKGGIDRMMSKSLSFNDDRSKHSSVAHSKVKMLSSDLSHVEDLKKLRHAKNLNSIQQGHKSKSDSPYVSSPVAGSGVSAVTADKKMASCDEAILAHSSRITSGNLKSVRFHGNSNNSSKPIGQVAPKGLKCCNDQGAVGAERAPLCLCDVVKDRSPKVSDSSQNPKPNHGIPETVLTPSSSWTANRRNCDSGAILRDHSSQTGKFSNQEEKSRDTNYFSQSRLNISGGSRSASCHKCKEIGHAAESCPTMGSRVPILDPRNSKEVNKSCMMEDVAKAAMVRRHESHKRPKCVDQSDELSISSSNMTCEDASNNDLPTRSTWLVNPFSADRTNEQDRVVKDVRWNAEHPTESAYALKVQKSNSIIPSDERLGVRDVPRFASTMSISSQISAVPELDHIWQGGFEVHRSGRLQSLHDRIQAHLSTCASPKVLEVVKKFPSKIILDEVPRLSTWPTQFLENYATEDNIALYFFASDLESYRRNYKSLLEGIIKNDFALKGNLNGIELLIFSSNLLPEKSQRWNALSFLWGVFRARKVNYSEHVSTNTQISIPCLNMLPSDQDSCITTPRQLIESLSVSNITPLELPCDSSGRKTTSEELPSRVNTISLSRAPMKGELMPSDMLHSSSFLQIEHKSSEGRLEVDPKSCLQAKGECKRKGTMVDERTECKRARGYFSGMYECNNSGGTKCSTDGYTSWTNGFHSFPVENQRCYGAHSIDIAEKPRMTRGSEFSASGLVNCSLEIESSKWQPLSTDGEDQTEHGYPNLELSLGTAKKSEKQGIVPSFRGIVDKKNNQDKHRNPEANREKSGKEPSLSLSLGFSVPDEELVPKPLPQWHAVNTLSLGLGGFPDT